MLKSRGQTPGQVTVADQLVEQLISRYANINMGENNANRCKSFQALCSQRVSLIWIRKFLEDPEFISPDPDAALKNWVVLYC
jgi:hypothetical protein